MQHHTCSAGIEPGALGMLSTHSSLSCILRGPFSRKKRTGNSELVGLTSGHLCRILIVVCQVRENFWTFSLSFRKERNTYCIEPAERNEPKNAPWMQSVALRKDAVTPLGTPLILLVGYGLKISVFISKFTRGSWSSLDAEETREFHTHW